MIYHVTIAIIDHKNSQGIEDERDKTIALIASKNAYYILAFTVITVIIHLLFPVMHQKQLNMLLQPENVAIPNEYLLINIIIFGALLAEIVKFSTQLFYYRKGF